MNFPRYFTHTYRPDADSAFVVYVAPHLPPAVYTVDERVRGGHHPLSLLEMEQAVAAGEAREITLDEAVDFLAEINTTGDPRPIRK